MLSFRPSRVNVCQSQGKHAESPCYMQELMAEALAELEVHNISTAPKFGISASTLEAAAEDQEACQQLFEQMKEAVGMHPSACSVQAVTRV